MKRITLTLCAAAVILFSCNSDKKDDKKPEDKTASSSEIKADDKAWVPVDSIMMDKYCKENMTISEQHKMLAKANGTWSGEISMWMADGGPEMKSTGTTVTKSLYNGLYQQTNHTGDMMGMPFEGMSIMGYDNMKKEFFSSWIDNMGSGIMMMTGQWDQASKKITLTGSTRCMNGQDAEMKEIFTMVDDDHQLLEMYGPDPKTGKQYKNMEIRYTRKK